MLTNNSQQIINTNTIYCKHLNLVKKLELPSSKHYARLVCADCGKFNKWLINPKTIDKLNTRQNFIDKLLVKANLTDWERSFLKSIYEKKQLSHKQENCLTRISTRY